MNAPFFLSHAEQTAPSEPAGMLFIARCIPDPFTGEQINVGVCALSASGRRHARFITEAGRLQCFYGDAAINVVQMAQAAQASFMAGHGSPTSQVKFDEPLPFYNSSLEDAVNSAFQDQITVAIPLRQSTKKMRFTDEDAITKVSSVIKLRKGLGADVLANTPQVIINTERGPRPVYVPLQPAGGVGTIRSAFYDPATTKTHLMDSVLDVECAARYRELKRQGLFILRPKSTTKERDAAIDAVIDSIAFRSPRGMHIGVRDSAEELADEIIEWAEAA